MRRVTDSIKPAVIAATTSRRKLRSVSLRRSDRMIAEAANIGAILTGRSLRRQRSSVAISAWSGRFARSKFVSAKSLAKTRISTNRIGNFWEILSKVADFWLATQCCLAKSLAKFAANREFNRDFAQHSAGQVGIKDTNG